jgi:hypothetical protein
MVVSQTIESISRTDTTLAFTTLLVLRRVFELRQAVIPEVAQQRAQLSQPLRPSPIQTPRTGAPLLDEAGFAQHAQVLRNGRTSHIGEARGDLTRGILAVADQAQDRNAARLTERVEDGGVTQRRLSKRIL